MENHQMDSQSATERVLSLDLAHLSEADNRWLHSLRNRIQQINIAFFLKEHGAEIEEAA